MKKLLLLIATASALGFISSNTTISGKERRFALKLLSNTEDGVLNSVKGLSEAQLKFKSAPDRWSVEECLKHIAISEQALWQLTSGTLQKAPNPEAKAEIKATDDQVVQMLEDRTHKVQTSDNLKPENTPFKSASEAIESFQTNRGKLISYVKSTREDLRNHVATLPFGKYDCYQLLLFIGAHSNRHTQQIEEVKADPNFPKN
jgi:uncharacterized damage-inducible protein DinB